MHRSERDDATIFEPGRNCWRVARADAFALIVDAADYFAALRRVMIAARRQLLLVGWDLDFEIEMLPGESDAAGLAPDGYPNAIGPFVAEIVARTPGLQVHMLKWNGALAIAPGRIVPALKLKFMEDERIHFALDGHHPFGACHHQKIVVADDALAFCGGIDVTEDRWDTSEHAPDDPRRVRKDGSLAPPWHDAMTAVTGPAAAALGELSRERWARATGGALEPPEGPGADLWPEGLTPLGRDVDLAIARTEPPFDGDPLVDEIERLFLDQVAAARKWIYIESQYFAAESIVAALEGRLAEPDGPEVVVINPERAFSELEDKAMHVVRGRMIERLEAADPGGRFRIYTPVNAAGEPIYVHAKVFVTDDRVLRIGSSNLDDRSMGFDTECDVAAECDGARSETIAGVRARLLGEHLGVGAEAFAAAQAGGSLIAAIERLNGPGRGLRRIERMPEGRIGRWLADTRVLDPRFRRGEGSAAGRGPRPRYIAAALGLAGAGVAAWLLLRAWRRR